MGPTGGRNGVAWRCKPVTLDYEDLVNLDCDLNALIAEAYGPSGLGILTVRGVPGLADLRQRLLPLAARFASFPDAVKARYQDKASQYNFGWSQGKETLEGGQPDENKGSWYANPLTDNPVADEQLMQQYPAYCRPNIWPREQLPELEGAFKELGQLIIRVGLLLTKHCDKYVASQQPGGTKLPARLHDILQQSPCPKGRLLHYYAPAAGSSRDDGGPNWCGWHTDHGSLTGLTCAMFLSPDLQPVPCPDPEAGLYVRTRQGGVVRVSLPEDHLGYQMGEAMQIHSGGALLATPHCVVAPRPSLSQAVSRNTLAVFMQPRWDTLMDAPPGVDAQRIGVGQWVPGMDFGEFTRRTLEKYYS